MSHAIAKIVIFLTLFCACVNSLRSHVRATIFFGAYYHFPSHSPVHLQLMSKTKLMSLICLFAPCHFDGRPVRPSNRQTDRQWTTKFKQTEHTRLCLTKLDFGQLKVIAWLHMFPNDLIKTTTKSAQFYWTFG